MITNSAQIVTQKNAQKHVLFTIEAKDRWHKMLTLLILLPQLLLYRPQVRDQMEDSAPGHNALQI